MEKERTKGPWVLDGHNLSAVIRCTVPRGHPDAKHLTGDYETIARCDGDNWKANAAFIVRAANSHEELVAAAKRVLDGLLLRIDNAPRHSVPVFDGIADLSDAINRAERRTP